MSVSSCVCESGDFSTHPRKETEMISRNSLRCSRNCIFSQNEIVTHKQSDQATSQGALWVPSVTWRQSLNVTVFMSWLQGMAGEWTQFISELFSGKSTPVNLPGSGDASKPSDPFQPFGSDASDPFQSKKGVAGVPGDPFSGKDPFAPSSSSKASRDSSLGFADFSSVSWAQWYSSSVQYTPLFRSLSLHSESWLFCEKKKGKIFRAVAQQLLFHLSAMPHSGHSLHLSICK